MSTQPREPAAQAMTEGLWSSEAFARYVEDSRQRQLWLARLLVGDTAAGEDLLQEGLYRLYLVWRRRGRPREPDAYLRITLVRLAARRSRRQWHREIPSDSSFIERPALTVDEADEFSDELVSSINELPLRQRTVLALRYVNNLSTKDCSAVMSCSESTVRSLASQALANLRTNLERNQNHGS